MFNPKLIQLETKHNNINKDKEMIIAIVIFSIAILLLTSIL